MHEYCSQYNTTHNMPLMTLRQLPQILTMSQHYFYFSKIKMFNQKVIISIMLFPMAHNLAKIFIIAHWTYYSILTTENILILYFSLKTSSHRYIE